VHGTEDKSEVAEDQKDAVLSIVTVKL